MMPLFGEVAEGAAKSLALFARCRGAAQKTCKKVKKADQSRNRPLTGRTVGTSSNDKSRRCGRGRWRFSSALGLVCGGSRYHQLGSFCGRLRRRSIPHFIQQIVKAAPSRRRNCAMRLALAAPIAGARPAGPISFFMPFKENSGPAFHQRKAGGIRCHFPVQRKNRTDKSVVVVKRKLSHTSGTAYFPDMRKAG